MSKASRRRTCARNLNGARPKIRNLPRKKRPKFIVRFKVNWDSVIVVTDNEIVPSIGDTFRFGG